MSERKKSNTNCSSKLVSLTDQELNEWVAKEIMGWRLYNGDWQYPHSKSKTGWFKIYNRYKFNPTKNLNHTHLMEEKIMENIQEEGVNRDQSAWDKYCINLIKVVFDLKFLNNFMAGSLMYARHAFEFSHASARQRAEAAYLTFKDEK